MFSLYNTCKTFSTTPSKQLRVHDEWAAYQFDSAVAWFGIYLENRLSEFDEKTGEPIYTLEQLLRDDKDEISHEDNMNAVAALSAVPGAMKVRKAINNGGKDS